MGRKSLTLDEFFDRSCKIHNDKYDYSEVLYSRLTVPVKIICNVKNHPPFMQRPNVHLNGSGCPLCSSIRKSKNMYVSNSDFIKKCNQIHGSKYSYADCLYKHSHSKVSIICVKHGKFEQTASAHLNGKGCPKCGGRHRINTSIFVRRAKKVHKNVYSYGKTQYTNSNTKVVVTCRIHGDFKQKPHHHLDGNGCYACISRGYSKIAIKWIEEKARSLRMKNVQHTLNGGEFNIPGIGKVDGYHARTKTVFEFHGDAYHGNPKIYKPSEKCHPYKNKLAKELYRDTMDRDRRIVAAGYKLITIWENDYKMSCQK